MSGNSSRIARDALQRPLRQLAVVLVAGGDGEGQRIDQQVGLRQAVLVAGEIDQPAGDAQLVARRSSPCRLRRWSARSPRRRISSPAPGGRRACFSPSSKLIELMIGLPPCSFSAASITGVSVLSITSGALTEAVKRRITSFISAISSRPTKAVQTSSALRALADLLAPHGDAAVPVVLFLQLAPFLRAVGVAALADGEDSVLLPQRHLPGTGWRPTAPRPACAPPAPAGSRRACAASHPAPRYARSWCRSSRRSD